MNPTELKVPQNVTNRYLNHLILGGSNAVFIIDLIAHYRAFEDHIAVGEYYKATVDGYGGELRSVAVGVSPRHAVRRALEALGVTFKA